MLPVIRARAGPGVDPSEAFGELTLMPAALSFDLAISRVAHISSTVGRAVGIRHRGAHLSRT